jgi:hypothetical protein
MPMTPEELRRRRTEDFDFLLMCEFKGNRVMYQLLRDRELDQYKDVVLSSGAIVDIMSNDPDLAGIPEPYERPDAALLVSCMQNDS